MSGERGTTLLCSLESSAFTAILTPRTLISRTQLEGGLKCTVRRRVVAIWRGGRPRDKALTLVSSYGGSFTLSLPH